MWWSLVFRIICRINVDRDTTLEELFIHSFVIVIRYMARIKYTILLLENRDKNASSGKVEFLCIGKKCIAFYIKVCFAYLKIRY